MSEQRSCPKCARQYSADVTYCPEDGAPLGHAGADPLLGTTLSGGVRVLSLCGEGSMGTVYRAWQHDMEREVAVKVLRRELAGDARVVKRFYREARAVARLNHPHIVTLHTVASTQDGRPFLLMEFVRGAHLGQLCAETGPLPAVRAIHICRQITAALAEAHANGVVHRDLKPANIVVADRRNLPDFVKVLDFGVAKILCDESDARLTQTGAIFGTPHFIAPEQASGAGPDPRSDIYSLGVVLFRMVTGRLPFDSPDGMEVLVQHIKQDPPLPRDIVAGVPLRLQEVVLRALAKKPSARWQTAEEFGAALQRVYEELRRWRPDSPAAWAPQTAAAAPQSEPSAVAAPPVATSFAPVDFGSATRRASAPISALPDCRQSDPAMSTQALGRQLRGHTPGHRRTLVLTTVLLAVATLALVWSGWPKPPDIAEPMISTARPSQLQDVPDAGAMAHIKDAQRPGAATLPHAPSPAAAIKRPHEPKRPRRRPLPSAHGARTTNARTTNARTTNSRPTVVPLGPVPETGTAIELGDHGSDVGDPTSPPATGPPTPHAAPAGSVPNAREEQQHERAD